METIRPTRWICSNSRAGFLMPKLNRTVSQTGKEALWTKDKQILLSSLEDFGYFTFADLDYFTIDKSVIASFKYFETIFSIPIKSLIKWS